jgi:hypothetical protein
VAKIAFGVKAIKVSKSFNKRHLHEILGLPSATQQSSDDLPHILLVGADQLPVRVVFATEHLCDYPLDFATLHLYPHSAVQSETQQ